MPPCLVGSAKISSRSIGLPRPIGYLTATDGERETGVSVSYCAKSPVFPRPQTALLKPRAPLVAAMLLAVIAALSTATGRADCSCICIDGLNRPLCSQVTDIEPVCPPKVCADAPATKPLEPYRLPPFDEQSCSMKYLYNKYAGRYEWRQVCR